MTYTCEFCGKEYKTEGWYNKHITSKHPGEELKDLDGDGKVSVGDFDMVVDKPIVPERPSKPKPVVESTLQEKTQKRNRVIAFFSKHLGRK